MRALGIICDRSTIQYTLVSEQGDVLEEAELSTPASRKDRGEKLNWLLDETEALLRRVRPDIVMAKKAGSGQFASSPERHELEAVLQIAAFRTQARCELKTTEQLRAAAGAPKQRGAYDALLSQPDVAARSNKDKRERYLFAITGLALVRDDR
jgi:hypothetical protein